MEAECQIRFLFFESEPLDQIRESLHSYIYSNTGCTYHKCRDTGPARRLTGISPFGGETAADTYNNIARIHYSCSKEDTLEKLSALAHDFICRLLLADPKCAARCSQPLPLHCRESPL